jgi:ABC-type nickel/cobalt efflux system permease component RcnA
MHGPAIPIFIILIAAVIGIIMIRWMIQKQRNEKKQYSRGHWMGVGIVTGMAIGMPFGLFTGMFLKNMAIGIVLCPAFGLGMGIAIGAVLKVKFQHNVRQMTRKEKHIQKQVIIASAILFILFILILIRKLFF